MTTIITGLLLGVAVFAVVFIILTIAAPRKEEYHYRHHVDSSDASEVLNDAGIFVINEDSIDDHHITYIF